MSYRITDKRFPLKVPSSVSSILLRRIALIFFVFVSLFFIFFEKMNSEFRSFIFRPVLDMITPVMEITNGVSKYSKNLVSSASEIIDLKKKNIILKQDNELLKLYYQKARDLEAENIQLRKLLNFVGQKSYKYVSAKIISVNDGAFAKFAVINIGSDQYIKNGQVVISKDGLVGRIVEIGSNSSRVLLLTDINSRVPVNTFNSRQRAILMGNNSDKMTLSYLSNPLRTSVGEFVVTSEDGGYFPQGIPVGIIERKSDKEVIVVPVTDLSNIDYVSVIVSE
jgi:rod shape-determining protein MreC